MRSQGLMEPFSMTLKLPLTATEDSLGESCIGLTAHCKFSGSEEQHIRELDSKKSAYKFCRACMYTRFVTFKILIVLTK